MSGWVNAASGEPVDTGVQPESVVLHQTAGEFEMGPENRRFWSGLRMDAQGRWSSVQPPEALGPSKDTPSLYEVRREALRAASNLTSSGGWMDAAAKTLEFAEKFEKYLLEVREK